MRTRHAVAIVGCLTVTGIAAAATGVTGEAVTFEDPAHDFPQRVIYRRVTPDSIHARIEGIVRGQERGQERGIDFPCRRMACAG